MSCLASRLADVTGDGLVDLLVGRRNYPNGEFLFVYPSSAPGIFGAPFSISLSGEIGAAAFGNVDGDAAREIAIVEYIRVSLFQRSEVVAWYDWNGAGFTRSVEVSAAGSADKVPTVMAALDLEGDGDSDLVYGRTNSMALRLSTTSGSAPGPCRS